MQSGIISTEDFSQATPSILVVDLEALVDGISKFLRFLTEGFAKSAFLESGSIAIQKFGGGSRGRERAVMCGQACLSPGDILLGR